MPRLDGLCPTRLKVLIADDRPDRLLQVSGMCLAAGFQTIETYSGEEAVALVQAETIDLIIVGTGLGDAVGSTVVRAIRDLPAPSGLTPVVGLPSDATTLTPEALADAMLTSVRTPHV